MPEVKQPISSSVQALDVMSRNCEETAKRVIDLLSGSELRNMDVANRQTMGIAGELENIEQRVARTYQYLSCIETLIAPMSEEVKGDALDVLRISGDANRRMTIPEGG